MTEKKPTLEYEARKPRRWPSWFLLAAPVLRSLVLVNLYGMAIIAPIFAVLGAVNLFHPVAGLMLLGQAVVTARDKIEWEISTIIMSLFAVPLAVWHSRNVLFGSRN